MYSYIDEVNDPFYDKPCLKYFLNLRNGISNCVILFYKFAKSFNCIYSV